MAESKTGCFVVPKEDGRHLTWRHSHGLHQRGSSSPPPRGDINADYGINSCVLGVWRACGNRGNVDWNQVIPKCFPVLRISRCFGSDSLEQEKPDRSSSEMGSESTSTLEVRPGARLSISSGIPVHPGQLRPLCFSVSTSHPCGCSLRSLTDTC